MGEAGRRRRAKKVAEFGAALWQSVGINDETWPAIRERWAREPEFREYMEHYPVLLLSLARLKSLLLTGDYLTLRRETEQAQAESKAKFDVWASERAVCPRCGGVGVHLAYGLPRPEGREAARRGEIALAGCYVGFNDPEWRCKSCRHKWGRLRPLPPA